MSLLKKVSETSLVKENQGITLGFERGANLGVSILSEQAISHAQLERDEVEDLVDFLKNQYSLDSGRSPMIKRLVNLLEEMAVNSDLSWSAKKHIAEAVREANELIS